MPTLLDTFRVLASFAPPRVSLRGAPWEDYVNWAISQGLGPLAAYNLEYRLGGGGAPEWARDRLLTVYQGSLNDNVMKLVHFKRTVDALEGRRVVVLGGASFAEALYPHVAFRPVLDLALLLPPADVDGFAGFLGASDFKPASSELAAQAGATRAVTDGRTVIFLHGGLLGPELDAGLFGRALPMRVYGPSFLRLSLEDAILVTVLEHARAGYDVPLLSFVDLRELLLGAPAMGGAYSRPPDPAVVRERAHAFRIERALWASVNVLGRLFPETKSVAAAVLPVLPAHTRSLLERTVVTPLAELGRMREFRGAERLRRLLTGGRKRSNLETGTT